MKYCHKCGANVKEGDLFCTSCGTKQNEEVSDNKINLNEKISNTFKQEKIVNFKDICLNMILKPVTGTKELIEKGNKSLTIALTIFVVFIQGLLGMWQTSQIFSKFGKIALEFIKKLSTLDNLFQGYSDYGMNNREVMDIQNEIQNFKDLIDVPYLKIFFQNVCTIIVIGAVIFFITYLALNLILHKKVDAFRIYKLTIGTLLLIVNFQVVSILCSYLSLLLGTGVMIIGGIVSMISFATIIREVFDINENTTAYLISIFFVVVTVINMILIQKFLLSNISDLILFTRGFGF